MGVRRARARVYVESRAIEVPSVNERERKAFEGRRPAGRAGVARVSDESVRVSLCHLRVGTRQRCYRNLSDVCLPVRRRRVVAVSVQEVCSYKFGAVRACIGQDQVNRYGGHGSQVSI